MPPLKAFQRLDDAAGAVFPGYPARQRARLVSVVLASDRVFDGGREHLAGQVFV